MPGSKLTTVHARAGHPDKQRIWRGTLTTIPQVTSHQKLSPAVIVVGKTAGSPMLSPSASSPPPAAVASTAQGSEAPSLEASTGDGGAEGRGDAGVNLVGAFDTWMLDLDGVLWGGAGVVQGSIETVAHLSALGKRVLYVTNNSARTRQEVAAKLMGLGFADIDVGDVVTSGWAAAEYLDALLAAQTAPCRKVFVIGSEALVSELQQRNIACISAGRGGVGDVASEAAFAALELDPEVQAVVCGWDPLFNWSKLAQASAYLQTGVPLVATNPDCANKVSGRLMPENGAQVAALVAAAGVPEDKVVVVGKPSPQLVETIVDKWSLVKSRTIMVGDRLDTDVVFGNRAGIATALVLSGVATRCE